ncbi:MAG TPA: hypothetical protein VK449_05600, partial [Anaerolineales bacterium]|nr:hypothetical protein [Anaerolineales bacterium]
MSRLRVPAEVAILLPSLLLVGCAATAKTPTPALTADQLANAEYQSPTPAEGAVLLTDGEYHE